MKKLVSTLFHKPTGFSEKNIMATTKSISGTAKKTVAKKPNKTASVKNAAIHISENLSLQLQDEFGFDGLKARRKKLYKT